MPDDGANPLLHVVRRTAAGDDVRDWTDCELLKRYVSHGDAAAFEVLVRRHGSMVWRVCRNRMRESHAAEDAFQATFLILVRKAGSIGRPERLGNWLYGVADRVARRARKMLARSQASQLPDMDIVADPNTEATARSDLEPLLHEEVWRLPAKYRSPIVLCYLEGRTNEEAARELRWPVGTLKVRLMRGRRMLRTRLGRHGLTLSAGALATALSADAGSAMPAGLLGQTLRAATLFAAGRAAGAVSASVIGLTEGVLQSMFATKLKIGAAVLVTAGLLGLGAGLLTFRTPAVGQTVGPAIAPVPSPAALAAGVDKDILMKAEIAKLQGTWNVTTLEINGTKMTENAFKGAKIVIKDEGFTTVSMGATYNGTFKVDVSRTPKTLDMNFTDGPEKGNTSLGIYELDGDTWKICLTVGGTERPKAFATTAGSGHALETLRRETPEEAAAALKKELDRLEGEWTMVSGTFDGQQMPEEFVKTGKRMGKGNETTVTMVGQVILQATFTIDPSKKPKTIDYTMTGGMAQGQKQYGIYEIDGDTVRFCFAVPGKGRPAEFAAKPGDGCTLTVWKRAKP